jgi:hypothetical protein
VNQKQKACERNSELIARLTAALPCAVWPREGRVSVYFSYTDETASPDAGGKFLISGFGARDTDWPEFSRQWRDKILLAPPKIPYVHMVDLRSESWRKKHGITCYEADEKVIKAIALIRSFDSVLRPYISQVCEKTYKSCTERLSSAGIKTQRHHGYVDYVAFIAYAFNLLKLIHTDFPDVHRVQFGVSKKNFVTHHIQHGVRDEMIQGMKKMNHVIASRFGDVLPLSMEDHMPLQAADVYCWHLQRTYSNAKSEQVGVLNNIAALQGMDAFGVDVQSGALERLTDNLIKMMKQDDEQNPNPARIKPVGLAKRADAPD